MKDTAAVPGKQADKALKQTTAIVAHAYPSENSNITNTIGFIGALLVILARILVTLVWILVTLVV